MACVLHVLFTAVCAVCHIYRVSCVSCVLCILCGSHVPCGAMLWHTGCVTLQVFCGVFYVLSLVWYLYCMCRLSCVCCDGVNLV